MLKIALQCIFVQINALVFHRAKIGFGEHAVIEQAEGETIDERMAEFFHQIQRQGGSAIAETVEKSDIGIQSVRGDEGEHFVGEHGVAKTEYGIDRVFWGTPAAGFETEVAAEHFAKGFEVDGCGNTFAAHQAVDGFLRWQIGEGLLDGFQFGGKVDIRIVALVAEDEGSAVCHFSADNCPGEVDGKFFI